MTHTLRSFILRLSVQLVVALALLLGAMGDAAFSQGKKPAAGKQATGSSKPAAGAARTNFVVKVPPGGKYLVSIDEANVAPTPAASGTATVEVPAGLARFTLVVVDEQSGYATRRSLEAKSLPAEVTIGPTDLKLVHLVKVRVTGKEGKPVANAAVMLEDANGKQRQIGKLEPARQGVLEVPDVPEGKAKLTVIPVSPDTMTTKEVRIGLQKGHSVQELTLAIPDNSGVVEGPAPAPGGAAAAVPAGTATATAPQPGAPPAPASPVEPHLLSSLVQIILGFLILAGIGYGVYVLGRKLGWTLEETMAKLGASPQTETVGGPSGAAPAPGPPPPPPPVVADPNRCQFCGELKDPATGQCACTLTATQAGYGAPSGEPVFTPTVPSAGPRLIATAGVYMGEIFPLYGDAVIGRDPSNSIALDRDSTVSRRHARLLPADGGYRILDEGSANGTFVNGARVPEANLHPGDEVSIGGTRFRFEV